MKSNFGNKFNREQGFGNTLRDDILKKQLESEVGAYLDFQQKLKGENVFNNLHLKAKDGRVISTVNIRDTEIDSRVKKLETEGSGVRSIKTAEEMDSLLTTGHVGDVYRYTGETTDKYIEGQLYIVTLNGKITGERKAERYFPNVIDIRIINKHPDANLIICPGAEINPSDADYENYYIDYRDISKWSTEDLGDYFCIKSDSTNADITLHADLMRVNSLIGNNGGTLSVHLLHPDIVGSNGIPINPDLGWPEFTIEMYFDNELFKVIDFEGDDNLSGNEFDDRIGSGGLIPWLNYVFGYYVSIYYGATAWGVLNGITPMAISLLNANYPCCAYHQWVADAKGFVNSGNEYFQDWNTVTDLDPAERRWGFFAFMQTDVSASKYLCKLINYTKGEAKALLSGVLAIPDNTDFDDEIIRKRYKYFDGVELAIDDKGYVLNSYDNKAVWPGDITFMGWLALAISDPGSEDPGSSSDSSSSSEPTPTSKTLIKDSNGDVLRTSESSIITLNS